MVCQLRVQDRAKHNTAESLHDGGAQVLEEQVQGYRDGHELRFIAHSVLNNERWHLLRHADTETLDDLESDPVTGWGVEC